MVEITEITRIDLALSNNNELTSYRFVNRLNARLYNGAWSDEVREQLAQLCAPIKEKLPGQRTRLPHSVPGCDSTGRSQASVNADDAFRAARRNLIYAMLEHAERDRVASPRNPMEIMRDRREAENQLIGLLVFTGFMGTEVARDYVRSFEAMVTREIGATAGCAVVASR